MEMYQCPQHEISYADGHKCPACERDALRAENEALKASVDDLAMLIRLLVHSLHKYNPDNETARRAVDYLRRHEILGSPLRHDLNSTPAADLSAHDARVRREALERVQGKLLAFDREQQKLYGPLGAWSRNHFREKLHAAILGPEPKKETKS